MANNQPSGILRYPYEALTDTTDYLQVTVIKYPGTASLVEKTDFGNNNNAFTVKNLAGSSLKPQQLDTNGVIILPMPSNIEDTNSVSYDGDSLNTIAADALSGVGALMKTTISKDGFKLDPQSKTTLDNIVSKFGSNSQSYKDLALAQLAIQSVNIFGANTSLQSVLSRSQGKILNPNMELLFNNVTLRTFRFTFKMTPRDEVESMQVKSIIRSFKRNMAAKSVSDGLFLETPNVFELQYKKGPKQHPFLHKFKQCALSDMSVNYTGENVYASYSDGTPISVILNLTFKELVPIYQTDYDENANLKYGITGTRTGSTPAEQVDTEGVGF